MKPFVSCSVSTIWVTGRSAIASKLIRQFSSSPHTLSFRKTTHFNRLEQPLYERSVNAKQVVICDVSHLNYSELRALQQLQLNSPTVLIVACFSSARLDILSYAWALDFAAYCTIDDSPIDATQLLSTLLEMSWHSPLHSPMFKQWLGRYGILFEQDHTALGS